jgi:hypothetical protein
MFVPCILDRVHYHVCHYVFWGTFISVFELPDRRSALLEGILVMCVWLGEALFVSCHNGIVYSHQLCSAERAFTYTYKDFCCLQCMLYESHPCCFIAAFVPVAALQPLSLLMRCRLRPCCSSLLLRCSIRPCFWVAAFVPFVSLQPSSLLIRCSVRPSWCVVAMVV